MFIKVSLFLIYLVGLLPVPKEPITAYGRQPLTHPPHLPSIRALSYNTHKPSRLPIIPNGKKLNCEVFFFKQKESSLARLGAFAAGGTGTEGLVQAER